MLLEYWRIARKRWKIVVACLLLGIALAVVLVVRTKPLYEAQAQIFVSTAGATDTSELAQGNTFTQARVQSYTAVANSPQVTEAVIKDLGLSETPSQLASHITADAPLNKVLINLQVTDNSANDAARIANSVAQNFSTTIEEIERTNQDNASPVKLTVTQPAVPPTSPVSPKPELYILIGGLIGLLGGFAIAFFRHLVDNSIKDVDELATVSELPVMARVPVDRRVSESVMAIRVDPHGTRAEAYRQLRTNLQFVDVDNPPKVIAVTSALPQEGKTASSVNLAAALAEAGQKVCLIEADLRKPTVASLLGLVSNVGLTSVLIGTAEVEDVMQNAGRNLAVLTSGPVPPNPSELLASDQTRRLIEYVSERVDVVVIDTAPLLPVTDGAEVAAIADATLLVVRASRTTREQVRHALETLGRVGVKPVGAILSMAQARGSKTDYYYYNGDYRPAATPTSKATSAPELEAVKSSTSDG